jgi:hypothetical protein
MRPKIDKKLNPYPTSCVDTIIWSIKPSHATVPLILESAGARCKDYSKVPFVQLLQSEVGENFATFSVENIHF